MTLEDRLKQNIGQLVFQVLHLQTENELLRKTLKEKEAEIKELEKKANV